ncbi:MAG TPA: GxxExxY protein [Gemmatimonadaceae bacterium]|jgi:GxxExxY protein
MKQQNTDVADFTDSHGAASTDVQDGDGEEHLLHHELTRPIIGAFYSVHSQLGSGFLEAVYANALAVLLRDAGFQVQREVPFDINFHGHIIGRYRADLIVESKVVVEVKCAHGIDGAHLAQVLNYLHASKLRVGLLLNAGRKAEIRRVIA